MPSTTSMLPYSASPVPIAKANEVAREERARLIRLASRERANPRSGSRGGSPSSIVLHVSQSSSIIFSQPTFQFGIPNFANELESSMSRIADVYFAELSMEIFNQIANNLFDSIKRAFMNGVKSLIQALAF